MSLSLRTNVASLNAQRNLYNSQSTVNDSMARLSSGLRITKAGDDAAGLAISVKLEAQIKSYNQAARNANDGLSMIQTAEAALNTSSNILTRLRELAMQSASDGIGNSERGYINTEASQLVSEIARNAASTKYNGTNLLDKSAGSTLEFQVGIGSDAVNDRITVDMTQIDATTTGLSIGSLDLSSKTNAQNALDTLDTAIGKLSDARSRLGAAGNRFSNAIQNIQTFAESLSAADSRIRDVDVAEETSNMSKSQILMQAGISVLAQANQQPQMALKLLG
jgi:flagellin